MDLHLQYIKSYIKFIIHKNIDPKDIFRSIKIDMEMFDAIPKNDFDNIERVINDPDTIGYMYHNLNRITKSIIDRHIDLFVKYANIKNDDRFLDFYPANEFNKNIYFKLVINLLIDISMKRSNLELIYSTEFRELYNFEFSKWKNAIYEEQNVYRSQ